MGVYLGPLYQEVEYIESSGTQYIDTGKTVSGDVKVDYTYMPKETVTSSTAGGLLVFIDNDRRNNGFGSSNTYTYYGGNTSNNEGYTVGTLQQDVLCHDIVAKSGCSRTLNGTTVSYVPSSSYPSPTGTLKLFVSQRAGSIINYWKTRMYSFKRYDSGVLTQDLVPCYRKSDNVIGVFDKVENKFYTNAGSGTFIKGNDVRVLQPELKNAYIGEVWTPGANTVVYYNIDDNDTTSAIYDKSGNNYTLSGGTFSFYTDANAGRCYTGGSYSTLPSRSIINFGNSFTFITWCKPTSAPGSTGMSAFANGATSSTHASNGISVFQDGKIVGWGAGVNNYNLKVVSDASAIGTYGQWKMIAYTRDSSGNLVLYLNGTSIKTNTVSGDVTYPSGGQFLLGGWRSGDKQAWNGYIKCLIGENVTWTATQILEYYNQTKANYGIS